MDRRDFLQTALTASGRAALGLGTLGLGGMGLAGCQGIAAEVPRVVGLKQSVPPQLVKRFRRSAGNSPAAKLAYSQVATLPEVFAQLQAWQQIAQGKRPRPKPWFSLTNPAPTQDELPDLVTIGDYWLGLAIKQGLIEPLDPGRFPAWKGVEPRWQQSVTRDDQGQISPTGRMWAAPYRWGATVIAYRADLLAAQGIAPPQDWSDLLNPQLKGRISLLDSPRETIGMVLKSLGKRYFTLDGKPTDLTQIPELLPRLQAFHDQAKFYSNMSYLQPLLLGHTWVAVGWSAELLQQHRTESRIAIAFPSSGTTVWADLWVRPKRAEPKRDRPYQSWINQFWEPEFAAQMAGLSDGGSVIANGDYRPFNLTPAQWADCELLLPLDRASENQFDTLWHQIRPALPA
jgi:putative spermidine/putrescine transport system substrate-binding protein